MDEINFSLSLYLVDRRPPEDVKSAVERALGCTLRPMVAVVPADELENRFEGTVFGVYVSLELASVWPEGNLYMIAGGTALDLHAANATKVSISSHVARMLRAHGFDKILSPREAAERNRQLQ
jgi:hypothetical protein